MNNSIQFKINKFETQFEYKLKTEQSGYYAVVNFWQGLAGCLGTPWQDQALALSIPHFSITDVKLKTRLGQFLIGISRVDIM